MDALVSTKIPNESKSVIVMNKQTEIISIPVRVVNIQGVPKPQSVLLEMLADDSLQDMKERLKKNFGIPVDKQALLYQNSSIDSKYHLETKIKDIKPFGRISRGSAVSLYDLRESEKAPLNPLSVSQTNIPPTESRSLGFGRQPDHEKQYVYCSKIPAHQANCTTDKVSVCVPKILSNKVIQSNLSQELVWYYKCSKCSNRIKSSERLTMQHMEMGDKHRKTCDPCGQVTPHTVEITCGKQGCNNVIQNERNILWHVFKNTSHGTFQELSVKFSECDHTIPLRRKEHEKSQEPCMSQIDLEQLLFTNLDGIIVENQSSTSKYHGEYVFACQKCKGRKLSYAALNTRLLLDSRLSDNINLVLYRKKSQLQIDKKIELGKLQLQIHEEACIQFIRYQFRCPTCKNMLETDDLFRIGTMHGNCTRYGCPQFCLMCLKTKNQVEGSCLFSHSLNSVIEPLKCPLFVETYCLFSDEPLQAWKDFIYWRTVFRMYEYCTSMYVLEAIKAVQSLDLYTKNFNLCKALLEKMKGVCVLPFPLDRLNADGEPIKGPSLVG